MSSPFPLLLPVQLLHELTDRALPDGIRLAFDGQVVTAGFPYRK
jgi:hypothetical protein